MVSRKDTATRALTMSMAVLAMLVLARSERLSSAQSPAGSVPTYSKDVAPILQQNCQVCHRPGEAGPFSLLTYADAKPWAGLMKASVRARRMPPWYADPRFGTFSNTMVLSDAEIDILSRWADGGAPEGNPADLPAPHAWFEGWDIGKPDMVFELPQPYDIPATGVVEYQHVIVPTNFTEDRWVQAVEVRPTARMVVHHIIAFVREPGSHWFRDQPVGVFFAAPKTDKAAEADPGALPSDFLVGYAPGQPAEVMRPGQAKLIKAGSDIIFQVHYTPHGMAMQDRSRLGLVFAKTPPKERVLTLSAVNDTFRIPPGDPNYKVDASFELGADARLASLHPHMHGRGKDFEYRVAYPSGKTETLLSVPRYDWHWQNWYNLVDQIPLPKGTTIEATAHFDNSAANKENPDPTKEVTWGDQHWDEMMIGFFNLVFDAKLPVQDLFVKKSKAEIAAK